jgi:hypothetical protein
VDPLAYYTTQSQITDPGEHKGLFADLPRTVDGLCKVVQGVYIHYNEGRVYGYKIPEERLPEINIRSVEEMLARIVELDTRPLREPRPPEKRLVGYCRDAAILFCAMARHQGIPARHRVGSATYFIGTSLELPGTHEIAEYWDTDEGRWRLVDPHLDALVIQRNNVQFDLCDVPREQFLAGGKAWQMCRAGGADPSGFGIGDLRGLWFIRNNMIQDLAAQNKRGPLNWDNWGLMLKEMETYTEEEWRLLDRATVLTQAGNRAFTEMRATYEAEIGLKVPRVIKSYGPVGEPREVTLPI